MASGSRTWHVAEVPGRPGYGVPRMMRLPENVRSLTNTDGGVILDLRRGKIFRLNPTGATILELLIRGYEEDRITAEISERCGIDSTLVSEDLQSFLKSLESNELLHRED